MTDTPARASAVIIGAGIVGNSLVHHLARLGWRDLVLVDKGPSPHPGGSTGHASNFIFPIEYSKMMFELTTDSTAQYQDLGVFTESGGMGGGGTPERVIELRGGCTRATGGGGARGRPGRARSRPRTSSSAAASGRRGSPGWPAPGSRSPRPCTR